MPTLNPIHTPKKFSCRTLEGEKNILQAHTPRKKNTRGIKGLKKKFMPIPNHPTPPLRS